MTNLFLELNSSPAALHHLRSGRFPLGPTVAGLILVFMAICAVAPHFVAPYDPYAPDLLASLKPPSLAHIFGTDQLGRDIFSRVVHGAGYSLYVGLCATALAVAVGVTVGVLAGVAGGIVDMIFMRIIDVLLAFPGLLMSMAVVAFLGTGITNILLAIAIASVPGYARIVRAQVMVICISGYVEAARVLGQPAWRTVLRHILPNTVGPLVVISTLGVGSAILQSSALSYLGLGPRAPTPEWGLMLAEGQGYLRRGWWIGVFPGVFATATIISITVLGRHLKARSDGRV